MLLQSAYPIPTSPTPGYQGLDVSPDFPGQVSPARHPQIHPGELDLVDRALLGGEGADLVRRHHGILCLLLRPGTGRAGLRGSGSAVDLGPRPALPDDPPLAGPIVGWHHIPHANRPVHTAGDDDGGFGAPVQRPDAPFAVTAHTSEKFSGSELPEDDGALVVGGGEKLSVLGARERRDVAGVAGEHADGDAVGHLPHTNCLVTAAGEDVSAVRVEGDNIDILVVAREYAQASNLVLAPETSCSITTPGHEVMSEWSPSDVPDGTFVAAINDHALPQPEMPETHGPVHRA